jgi:hypothetical protein
MRNMLLCEPRSARDVRHNIANAAAARSKPLLSTRTGRHSHSLAAAATMTHIYAAALILLHLARLRAHIAQTDHGSGGDARAHGKEGGVC